MVSSDQWFIENKETIYHEVTNFTK